MNDLLAHQRLPPLAEKGIWALGTFLRGLCASPESGDGRGLRRANYRDCWPLTGVLKGIPLRRVRRSGSPLRWDRDPGPIGVRIREKKITRNQRKRVKLTKVIKNILKKLHIKEFY